MVQCQIRTGLAVSIDDVAHQMASAMWDCVRCERIGIALEPVRFPLFASTLRDMFFKRLSAYDTCGMRKACDIGVRASPWSHEMVSYAALVQQTHEIQPLQLEVEKGLGEFVDQMVDAALNHICSAPRDNPVLLDQWKKALSKAVRGALAPYLYQNIFCEMCPLRQYRKKIPLPIS